MISWYGLSLQALYDSGMTGPESRVFGMWLLGYFIAELQSALIDRRWHVHQQLLLIDQSVAGNADTNND